ncbi:MAG: hypothetical protein H6600_06795 [Flavobacteriales bacterium]|nr:hypothetical protein [Flavobacteriales bacterium]MCB9198147.1 hypothetical protein [Flavobacteriales bacterium]
MKIILLPLQGVKVGNQFIEFGTPKKELINMLGRPSSDSENQLFYDDLEIRIDLDDSEKIEFIEFLNGPFPEKTEVEIYGVNPFQVTSHSFIQLLSEKNNGQVDDTEEPYCYSFLESSVGIFRDSCEVDVEEMISEMKEEGTYSEHEDWILEDKEKAKYFWTIGIGSKNYYK